MTSFHAAMNLPPGGKSSSVTSTSEKVSLKNSEDTEAFWGHLCTEPSGDHFGGIVRIVHLESLGRKPWPLNKNWPHSKRGWIDVCWLSQTISQTMRFSWLSVYIYVCVSLCACVCMCLFRHVWSFMPMHVHVQISRSVAQYQQLHQSSSEPGGSSVQVSKRIFAAATCAAITYCSPRQRVRSTSRAERIKSQGAMCPKRNVVARSCMVLSFVALASWNTVKWDTSDEPLHGTEATLARRTLFVHVTTNSSFLIQRLDKTIQELHWWCALGTCEVLVGHGWATSKCNKFINKTPRMTNNRKGTTSGKYEVAATQARKYQKHVIGSLWRQSRLCHFGPHWMVSSSKLPLMVQSRFIHGWICH